MPNSLDTVFLLYVQCPVIAATLDIDIPGVLISPWPNQEGNKLERMLGTRAISTTWRRELSSSFFFFLQSKAPKEIHAILTETLAFLFPGRAKDLSTPLYTRTDSD